METLWKRRAYRRVRIVLALQPRTTTLGNVGRRTSPGAEEGFDGCLHGVVSQRPEPQGPEGCRIRRSRSRTQVATNGRLWAHISGAMVPRMGASLNTLTVLLGLPGALLALRELWRPVKRGRRTAPTYRAASGRKTRRREPRSSS
jgi:hypothetical protein